MRLPAPLILGSQSPRRKQLLSQAGFEFEVIVRSVEETFPTELSPEEVAIHISEVKAKAFEDLASSKIVVTADTIVVNGDEIMGKPVDYEDAFQMIRRLTYGSHQVISGVSVYYKGQLESFTETTEVYFRKLEDSEIDYYISEFKPFDKAGAYGIQDWIGMIGIERIEGDFYNVMGLPIGALYRYLKKLN